MSLQAQVDTSFWCERVRLCFSMFAENPKTLQHLLLYGPPGSGKTTSAAWLVDKIWKSRKSLMCISMNAADERSLEAIRQKVFPFIRVDWRQEGEDAPRFLILDECETLTEAAQLSLQTILTKEPSDVCVIIICNSQSRIHPKLRQRLLKLRYDPPNRLKEETPDLFTSITRGDLRFSNRKADTENRVWNYIHEHPDRLHTAVLSDTSVDYHSILSEILLVSSLFNLLDEDLLKEINNVYSFVTEGTVKIDYIQRTIVKLIKLFQQKFERAHSKI